MTETQEPRSLRWLIREPHESEFPAFRMLLPDVAANTSGRVLRLAVDSAKPSIAGALAYSDHSQSITNVRLHVVKTCRRQGVGSALLNYAVDEARGLGRTRVFADADMRKEPDAEAFLAARSFRRVGQLTTVRRALAGRGPKAALFQKYLAKAQQFPPGSRIVRMSEAPAGQIKALFKDYIANVPLLEEAHRNLRPERHRGLAVMVGDRVISFILTSVQGNCAHVPALVVVPEYRGRGLTFRMMEVLAQRADPAVTHVQFEFTESAAYTAKMAAEFGYEILRVAVRFQDDIENGPA